MALEMTSLKSYILKNECWNKEKLTWWRHHMERFPCYWPFIRGTHRSQKYPRSIKSAIYTFTPKPSKVCVSCNVIDWSLLQTLPSVSHGQGMLLIFFHWHKHEDIIKGKHFPRYWPFVRGIHRSPVNSPHKGQWRGALMFSLICVWINGSVNNREAGDLRRHRAHYDAIVMCPRAAMDDGVWHQMWSYPYLAHCHQGRLRHDWHRTQVALFNSLRPSDAYMHPWFNHHWFR